MWTVDLWIIFSSSRSCRQTNHSFHGVRMTRSSALLEEPCVITSLKNVWYMTISRITTKMSLIFFFFGFFFSFLFPRLLLWIYNYQVQSHDYKLNTRTDYNKTRSRIQVKPKINNHVDYVHYLQKKSDIGRISYNICWELW